MNPNITHSQQQQAHPGSIERSLRILVADDEPLIQRAIARCLPQHEVVCVSTGTEALELAKAQEFSVMLCDLYMPCMDGPTLYGALREQCPTLAQSTIFMTGGANSLAMESFIAHTERPILEKPFRPTELRSLIALQHSFAVRQPAVRQAPR